MCVIARLPLHPSRKPASSTGMWSSELGTHCAVQKDRDLIHGFSIETHESAVIGGAAVGTRFEFGVAVDARVAVLR